MAIMLFSIVASIVLGCSIWLVLGDQFPLKEEVKLPALNNITIYSLSLLLPVYLLVFFLF